MRAVWITKVGPPEVLAVRETADPEPGPGEIRVRVKAAGLSFSDVMARQGLYPDAPKPPCVVGYEIAGVVDKLGPAMTAVTAPAVGTRVMALVRFGGHADVACLPAEQAVEIPDELGFEQAAAIPVNYLTAYHMVVRVATVQPGERVLVHMAAGGVGIAVLQLCGTIHGVVTYGTASAAKHDVLRAEGCTHPIDYRSDDYVRRVRELTGGQGVDVVLDPLGGRDWKKGLSLLRPAGRLVAYGFANLASGERRSLGRLLRQAVGVPLVTPLGLMDRNHTISGVNLGHLWDQATMLREGLQALVSLARAGDITPRIDTVVPFAHAAHAHRRITERRNIGKIVLIP
ncbi:medium chain dehydrogenase/reductase family protein [Planotetraspora phitsanulokensis]|uniref:Oxidoreductase n=1 Tax=Planotetraspora phitsanulokensis TaxID=575192 RepID=A0A8J3XMW0_9ACTN|nr:oxidoreductase [Planotetraspora phitsanulokensis]